MTLFCDLTSDDSLFLALKDGKRLLGIRRFVLHRGQHESVLPRVFSFLKSMGAEISGVHEIVVVSGPGRFSSLRVMIIIANVVAWSRGCALFTVRKPSHVTDDARYLAALDRAKRPVQRVAPFYGRPPSITRPTK